MDNKDGYRLNVIGYDNRNDNYYDQEQLHIGLNIEKEHTHNINLAKSIVKDHLDEIPDYYTRLIKMEEEAKNNAVELDSVSVGDLTSIISSVNDKEDKNKKVVIHFGHAYSNIMENPLICIIAALGYLGNDGHSFNIVLDPGTEQEISFGWDGDGVDYISKIQCGDFIINSEDFSSFFKDKE